MFKEFKLKKKSWHMWVMKYIWNLNSRDFSHMCPYFWLSVFNVFVAFIPVVIVKSVTYCISMAITHVRKMNKASKEVKMLNRRSVYGTMQKEAVVFLEILEKDDTRLELFAKQISADYWERGKLDKLGEWINTRLPIEIYLGPEVYKRFQEYRFKYSKIYEDEYSRKKSREYNNTIANKQRINTILKYVAPVAQGIIFILALATLFGAFYWSFIGINLLFGLSSEFWGDFKWWIGFIILCIAALIAVIYTAGFIVIVLRGINIDFESPFWEKIGDFLYNYLLKPIFWFFRGIGTICNIIKQMFQNNCPPIKWD